MTTSNTPSVLPTCSAAPCAAAATHTTVVKPSGGIFGPQWWERRYDLCERHEEEYFGGSPWRTAEQSERVQRELVPK